MNDPALQTLISDLSSYLQLDRLPELAVLLIGIAVGIAAKNVYAVVKNALGFAGSFAGKLAVGWWQEFRRETPNVLGSFLVLVSEIDGRRVVVFDPLLGPHKLTDVFINPSTAFGVRIQAFRADPDRPWMRFTSPGEKGLGARLRAWRNRRRVAAGRPEMTSEMIRRIKYRRVYSPLENLIGQFLTNEWAVEMAVGEPCCLFRFIVALVYEKHADDYMDRHFQALLVWDETLQRLTPDDLVVLQPEHAPRARTLARVAAGWREHPEDFGTVFMPIPKRLLAGDYAVHWVENAAGDMVPVHRPVALDAVATADLGLIGRLGRAT